MRFETLAYAECAQEVAAFRNLNRGTQPPVAYFAWRYASRPCALGAYVTWGRNEHGEPVAAASFIAHDFSVLGVQRTVGVVGDISVLPACRGRGIARQLLAQLRQHAAERGLTTCFVLPNADVTGALLKAGWQQVAAIARDVRLLSVRSKLGARFGGAGRLAARLIDPFLGQRGTAGAAARSGGFEVGPMSEFGADFESFWESVPKSASVLGMRSRDFMRWRFMDKPGNAYRLMGIWRGGELRGYAVYHLEGPLACIDDFLVHEDAASVLGSELVRTMRADPAVEAIQARYVAACTSLPIPWAGAGFVRRADTQLVMWSEIGAPTDIPANVWYVTPADKDV